MKATTFIGLGNACTSSTFTVDVDGFDQPPVKLKALSVLTETLMAQSCEMQPGKVVDLIQIGPFMGYFSRMPPVSQGDYFYFFVLLGDIERDLRATIKKRTKAILESIYENEDEDEVNELAYHDGVLAMLTELAAI